MQNAVSVHIKGKGHRTPGTVWPWHGISDHRLSFSAGLRLLVPRQTGGAISRAQHLAAQQAPEVLTLPLFRLLVIQETSLLTAKFWGMDRPASVQVLTRDELVQHLVEDDVFDNVARHKGLVQETVDADEPIALL